MIAIITMAGQGKRFKNKGYTIPKYMVECEGKTLFEWSISSLSNLEISNFIFIVRSEDNSNEFISNICLKLGILYYDIINIDFNTRGQAESAYIGMRDVDGTQSILIYNIDTYIEPTEIKNEFFKMADGIIPCFNAEGNHWSFVRTDESGIVVEITEKKRISNNCSVGMYYFRFASLFKEMFEKYSSKFTSDGELYVAPIYNYLLSAGYNIVMFTINKDKVHVLGTPEELEQFLFTRKNSL